jgi:hypothetical protein
MLMPMGLGRKTAETEKRNLAQRIKRLLDTLEEEGRAPTAHESLCIRRAIHALQVRAFRQGHDAMVFAEQPDTYTNAIIVPPDRDVLGIAELRELLAQTEK